MNSFRAEYMRLIRTPFIPAIWLALSGMTVIAGPFGTSTHMSLPMRALYWPVVVLISILGGTAIRAFVRARLGVRRDPFESLLISVLIAGLLTPAFWALAYFLAGAESVPLQYLPRMMINVFGIALGVACLCATVRRLIRHEVRNAIPPVEQNAVQADVSTPAPPVRLLERLEPDLRQPLLRMQVRDHYVDVVTEAGEASLLMRFADAIAETEGIDGLRVHRSHWVARDAIVGLRRDRGKPILITRDGAEIPVSKTYQHLVEGIGMATAAE